MPEVEGKKKIRSYVSGFTIRVGPLSVSGKLVPVQKPKPTANRYHLCSPDHKPVKQKYQDEDGNLFEPADLLKYVEGDDGEIQVIDAEALKEAKKSELPANVMNVSVHPIEGLDNAVYPRSDTSSFVFVPDADDPSNVQITDLITGLVNKGKYALMANVNIRNYEKVYRLIVWRGWLVLQPQTWTDALHEHDVRGKSDVSKTHIDKGLAILAKLEVEFDPDTYVDTSAERVAAVEAGKADAVKVTQKVKPKADLLDILDSALEGV